MLVGVAIRGWSIFRATPRPPNSRPPTFLVGYSPRQPFHGLKVTPTAPLAYQNAPSSLDTEILAIPLIRLE
jgi:hypothetical protein